MSKTRKIRRLKRQLSLIQEDNKWLYQNFLSIKRDKFTPVKRPVFRSNNWQEEQAINFVSDHIYDTLDNTLRFHNKLSNECNFVVYISKDILYRLASVEGYRHLVINRNGNGFHFM